MSSPYLQTRARAGGFAALAALIAVAVALPIPGDSPTADAIQDGTSHGYTAEPAQKSGGPAR